MENAGKKSVVVWLMVMNFTGITNMEVFGKRDEKRRGRGRKEICTKKSTLTQNTTTFAVTLSVSLALFISL